METGPSYSFDPENGLLVDDKGNLVQLEVDQRWAVSGRTEYDNKGLPRRRYQPYFFRQLDLALYRQ